jgi:fructokinase
VRIVAIGEILWNLLPSGEQLGGAPLHFAAHMARLGHEVLLVSAVGEDPRGTEALAQLTLAGLSTTFVQVAQDAGTGTARVRLDEDRQPVFEIDRPAAFDSLSLSNRETKALQAFEPDWIYHGTLFPNLFESGETLASLRRALPNTKRAYDINLRPGCWDRALLNELLPGAHLVNLNLEEAALFPGGPPNPLEPFCRQFSAKFRIEHLCLTRGSRGAAVYSDGKFAEHVGFAIDLVDATGAGDAFAAAYLHGLSKEWSIRKRIEFANRLAALVASRPGALPKWTKRELDALEPNSISSSRTRSL